MRSLATGQFEAGRHDVRWDGLDQRGRTVADGVYFVRIEADGKHVVRKWVHLKGR